MAHPYSYTQIFSRRPARHSPVAPPVLLVAPKSQCAAVAAKLMPHVSAKASKRRAEKISAARKLLGQTDTETRILVSRSNSVSNTGPSTRYYHVGYGVSVTCAQMPLRARSGRCNASKARSFLKWRRSVFRRGEEDSA